jgi:hypothetical protein
MFLNYTWLETLNKVYEISGKKWNNLNTNASNLNMKASSRTASWKTSNIKYWLTWALIFGHSISWLSKLCRRATCHSIISCSIRIHKKNSLISLKMKKEIWKLFSSYIEIQHKHWITVIVSETGNKDNASLPDLDLKPWSHKCVSAFPLEIIVTGVLFQCFAISKGFLFWHLLFFMNKSLVVMSHIKAITIEIHKTYFLRGKGN